MTFCDIVKLTDGVKNAIKVTPNVGQFLCIVRLIRGWHSMCAV